MDRFKYILLFSTAICSGIIGSSVHSEASTVAFIDTYGETGAVSEISGAFDISDFIADEALAGNDVTVNSATIYMYGYSAANNSNSYTSIPRTGYATGYYTYSCGWRGRSTCGGSYTYTYTYYVNALTSSGDQEADVVLVDFGDQALSGSTQAPNTYSYSSYYGVTTTTGHSSGTVADLAILSTVSLDDLLTDNILNYLLTVTSGVFDELTVELKLDYDTTASSVNASIPLPGTLPMLGSGLALLALERARRKKKKTTA